MTVGGEPDEPPLAEQGADGGGLVPRSDAMGNVREPKELTSGVPPADPPSGSDIGGPTLSGLLTFHPFVTFFCWLAYRQISAKESPEGRVAALRDKNGKFYWLCVTLDVVISVTAVLILIAAAAAVLYKTIWLDLNGNAPPLP